MCFSLLSHGSGGWKSETQVSAVLVSLKASLLGLQTATVSLCVHTVFSTCAHTYVSSPSNMDAYLIG